MTDAVDVQRFYPGDRVKLDDGRKVTVMTMASEFSSPHYLVAPDEAGSLDRSVWELIPDRAMSKLHWRDDDRFVMRTYQLSSNNVRLLVDALAYYAKNSGRGSLDEQHALALAEMIKLETEYGKFTVEVMS